MSCSAHCLKWIGILKKHVISLPDSWAVTENVLGRLTIADRNLVPSNTIDVLEGQSQRILELIKSLEDSAPSVEIDLLDASNRIDKILATASSLPVLRIRTTNEVLEKAAGQFDREASSAQAAISREVDSLRTEMANFYQGIQEATTDFNKNLTEFSEQVDLHASEAQSTAESLLARVNEATERLQREVTSIQETFRASQSRQSAEFTVAQETRDREFHERLDSTLEDIENYRDQAKKMLEEVAGASSAEHYTKLRDSQKKNADIWRWIGVGGLFILVVAAGLILLDTRSTDIDFSTAWLVARSSLLFSLGISRDMRFVNLVSTEDEKRLSPGLPMNCCYCGHSWPDCPMQTESCYCGK